MLFVRWHNFLFNSIMPSSVVDRIVYIEAKSALRITFVSGLVYEYRDVPEKVYQEMKAASSKGTYFNQHIKGHYAFKKLN